MSARRSASRAARRAVVEAVFERDGYRCQAEALVPEVVCCGGLEPDEIIGRGRGGDEFDMGNVQTLCHAHHRWKTDNPRAATERGLSRSLPPPQ